MDPSATEPGEEDGDEHAQEVVRLEEYVQQRQGPEGADQDPAGDHRAAATAVGRP